MDYKHIYTTGELIEILQKYPKDTKIFTETQNMERVGYDEGMVIRDGLEKFKKETRTGHDAFDYCDYEYTAIFSDDNGDIEGILI